MQWPAIFKSEPYAPMERKKLIFFLLYSTFPVFTKSMCAKNHCFSLHALKSHFCTQNSDQLSF